LRININSNVRNVAIILAVAAFIAIVPAGGTGARFVLQLVSLAFLAAIAWIATRLYRDHRIALYSLGDRQRATLYVAVGVAVLTMTANGRLTQTGGGTVVFLVLLIACAVAIFSVFQSTRSY
jgi:hypothetical protein